MNLPLLVVWLRCIQVLLRSHNVELTNLKDSTKNDYKINTFDVDGTEYDGEIHCLKRF